MYYIKRTFPYWNLGKFEFCIQDCDKALELNPNDAGIYKHRGDCYKELGDETKAQADFKKAKELG
ncbi:MAG: tetratricopeptide repeat protein [Selenomonadaceae bacterium]|nr:tetratricopeptide repeat protein [Selenomonadaceae bacterium]